jgi:hypothetical protein
MNNKEQVKMLINSYWRTTNEGFKYILLKEIYKLIKEDIQKEVELNE